MTFCTKNTSPIYAFMLISTSLSFSITFHRTHYKEYLVDKINSNKLDPLVLYDDDQIKRILEREEKAIPQKEEEDNDEQYRQKLIEVLL